MEPLAPEEKLGEVPKLGMPSWGGPHNSDYNTLGSLLGSP